MQVVKGKELRASGVGRAGAPGVGADAMRVFNRAFELLSSSGQDSDNELLDMVKRAKRDTDEVVHLPKKPRSGRSLAESSELLQALGHRLPAVPAPPVDQPSSQPADSGGDASAASGASSAGNTSMTQAQTRLMNVIRGGPGRGRIEKPRRKVTR